MVGAVAMEVKAKEVDDGGLDLAQDLAVGVGNNNNNTPMNHTMVPTQWGTHPPLV